MNEVKVIIPSEDYWKMEKWLTFKPGDFPIRDASSVDQYVAAILNVRRLLGMPLPLPIYDEITQTTVPGS